jgi:acyl-CoA thioesterase-2
MPDNLEKLLGYLETERAGEYHFIGRSPKNPPRVFGGQVLAQSLYCALQTVEPDRVAHSLHAYFLRPGNPQKEIHFEVDPIRDGRSFTTRRVVAKQDDRAIFNTSISLQVPEAGLSHQSGAPQVPPPEELESDNDFWKRMEELHPGKFRFYSSSKIPIERRPVIRRDPIDPQPHEPEQQIWMKATGELGEDPRQHQMMLAFMSDFVLLGTALFPHPYTGMSKNLQAASLDHALWFHRPFRADEYLLYATDSPNASGGRGLSRGSFYTREGELVASTVQESLIRPIGNLGSVIWGQSKNKFNLGSE